MTSHISYDVILTILGIPKLRGQAISRQNVLRIGPFWHNSSFIPPTVIMLVPVPMFSISGFHIMPCTWPYNDHKLFFEHLKTLKCQMYCILERVARQPLLWDMHHAPNMVQSINLLGLVANIPSLMTAEYTHASVGICVWGMCYIAWNRAEIPRSLG